MARTSLEFPAVAILFALAVSGCAPLQQYRTNYEPCVSNTPDPSEECLPHALQEYRFSTDADQGFLLGFVEFDDQGLLFDRNQLKAVVDRLYQEAATKDLLIVVFMHGWKHNAAPGDDNISTFRNVLMDLSAAEDRISKITGDPPRQVAGVYLGWRGASLTLPLLEELTFWERKNTAEKVGHVGVTEVLVWLDRIKRDKDSTEAGRERTKFVVAGHSFGGAALFSALSQILESKFINTVGPAGTQSDAAGFGNLVVLINPAFEALLFAPISDMSTDRGRYFESQLPVLAVLTSEGDDATGIAFPVGRWFSTFFEKGRDMQRRNATTNEDETISEGKANITAVGHFEPYRTHYLRATEPQHAEQAVSTTAQKSVELFAQTSDAWEQDRPGSTISFGDSELERTKRSAGRNPYLVVGVDKEIIESHSDISDPRMIEFIKQLILISSQNPQQKQALEKMRLNPELH